MVVGLQHTHTHTHTHTHAHAQGMRAHARMYAHTHTRVCMHARTHTHTRTHARTYTRTHTHTHTHRDRHSCGGKEAQKVRGGRLAGEADRHKERQTNAEKVREVDRNRFIKSSKTDREAATLFEVRHVHLRR